MNDSTNYLKEKIEEYQKEMFKLESQKEKYLENDKNPPTKIVKRIGECNIIISYCEELLNKMNELEFEKMRAQMTPISGIPMPAELISMFYNY